MQRIASELDAAANDLRGERVREGFRAAIIGAPNVGKSSVLNALSGRGAAIVTATAGTTRDIVEIPINLAGQTLVLADTAGLRETIDEIEAEGVRRARAWSLEADLGIGVVDLTRPDTWDDVVGLLQHEDLIVLNKADLVSAHADSADVPAFVTVRVSAASGEVASLRDALADWLTRHGGAQEFPATTRGRHRALLAEAADHLQRSLHDLSLGAELAAENVRLSIRALERVSGRSDPEALLDRVFAGFCIGK